MQRLWLDRGEVDKIIERRTSAEAQARLWSLIQVRYYDDRHGGYGGHHGRAAADRSCRDVVRDGRSQRGAAPSADGE